MGHQLPWPPAGEAHPRELGRATWRCASTTGCGKRARVHPVEVPTPCCPHDLHHVPLRGDGGRHGPPTPARPGGRGPRRDDYGGAVGRGGGVAARAAEEDEDPDAEVDPGCRP